MTSQFNMNEIIRERNQILRDSIALKWNETIECSKCKIRYVYDHVFTQAMFDAPCPYDKCGGTWIIRVQRMK